MILKDLKEYINDFDYKTILISEKRICFINSQNMEFIQIIGCDVYDILNCIINTNNNFKKDFNCKSYFTTDDYIIEYTKNYNQIV